MFQFLLRSSTAFDELPDNFTWSDRGTVCEYKRGDSLPFEKIADLGRTNTAQIDSVKCKGVLLARKQIFWTGRVPRREIEREITILKRLSHHHVIRFVGSYTQGKCVGILLYPVASCDLKQQLRMIDDEKMNGSRPSADMRARLRLAFGCLTSGLAFVHLQGVKHKDIKPENILWHKGRYMFIDFGISTEIAQMMDSLTTGPTALTELVRQT